MGTWGVHSFENDTAVEWAAAYREMGLSVAGSTIRIALEDAGSKGLDADMASRGIAAAEAVAFALGRGHGQAAKLFDGAAEAERSAAEALVEDADTLVGAVAESSQLAVQWKDAGEDKHGAWLAAMSDLRRRLRGQADAPAAAASEPVAAGASLEELQAAVAGLSRDIEVLRKDMMTSFRHLAKMIEGSRP